MCVDAKTEHQTLPKCIFRFSHIISFGLAVATALTDQQLQLYGITTSINCSIASFIILRTVWVAFSARIANLLSVRKTRSKDFVEPRWLSKMSFGTLGWNSIFIPRSICANVVLCGREGHTNHRTILVVYENPPRKESGRAALARRNRSMAVEKGERKCLSDGSSTGSRIDVKGSFRKRRSALSQEKF